jgi:hypothetical protein
MAERGTFEIRGNEEAWEKYKKTGSEEVLPKVSADDILDAIVKGQNINLEHVIIHGELNIDKKASIYFQCACTESRKPILKSDIGIRHSIFEDYVSFVYAIFMGIVYFRDVIFCKDVCFDLTEFNNYGVPFENSSFRGRLNFSNAFFKGDVNFCNVNFNGDANFYYTRFMMDAKFTKSSFDANVDFKGAKFFGSAEFDEVAFTGKKVSFKDSAFRRRTSFASSTFNVVSVDFTNTIMKYPASFESVDFYENTLCRWFCNFFFGRIEHLHRTVTDFSGFNTNIIDSASNPYLKRYIDDELWIKSWRERNKKVLWRRPLFFIWEITSHCGRSFALCMFWVLLIAFFFGAVYADYSYPSWMPDSWENFFVRIDPKVGIVSSNLELLSGESGTRLSGNFTPYYFSIVTLTTLGFGDVQPFGRTGEIWLAIEVILGYVMLGGLISIFANIFARRS